MELVLVMSPGLGLGGWEQARAIEKTLLFFMNNKPMGEMPGVSFSLWNLKGYDIWWMHHLHPCLDGWPRCLPPGPGRACVSLVGRRCSVWAVVLLLWAGEVLGAASSNGCCIRLAH